MIHSFILAAHAATRMVEILLLYSGDVSCGALSCSWYWFHNSHWRSNKKTSLFATTGAEKLKISLSCFLILGSTCGWVWTYFVQSVGEDTRGSPWLQRAWQGGLKIQAGMYTVLIQSSTKQPSSFNVTPLVGVLTVSEYPFLHWLEKGRKRKFFSAYVQKCSLIRFMYFMIDITRCLLTLILTKTHVILSNMKSYENDKNFCLIWSTKIQG